MALRFRSYLLIILLVLATLVTLLWPQLLSYAAQYALQSAQSPSLKLSWTGAQGYREGVHFDSIDAIASVSTGSKGPIKALPVRISASNVWIKPTFLSALINQQAATFSADLLGGSVSGSLSGALGSPTISVAWSNIEVAALARYPVVRAVGISTGVLEGTATVSGLDPATPPRSLFSATLRDFAIPRNSFSSVLKLQPGDLVTVSVSGSSSPETVAFQPLSITGFFGKIISNGTVAVSPQAGIRDVDVSTNVELTPSGGQRFGQWLPLLSNNLIQAETRSFSLKSKTIPCPSGGHPYTIHVGSKTLCFSNQFNQGR